MVGDAMVDEDAAADRARAEDRVVRAFVPGRLCLLGEHSDWAAERASADGPGACLVVGTREGIEGEAFVPAGARRGRFTVRSAEDGETYSRAASDELELERDAREGGRWSYVAGTLLECVRAIPEMREGGLEATLTSKGLPVKRGLSSSAAACVLVARLANLSYARGWTVEREMEVGYLGESTWTPSKCGRMDQACAYGPERCTLMTFDAEKKVTATRVTSGGDVHVLVVDLEGTKDTIRILADLSRAFDAGDVKLRAALGSENRRHVDEALRAIQLGDAKKLGAACAAAQATFMNAAKHLCPSELSAPIMHDAIRSVEKTLPHLIYGAKGVGSQGDGAVQFVCRGANEARELRAHFETLGKKSFIITLSPDAREAMHA
jgi:galactokinase